MTFRFEKPGYTPVDEHLVLSPTTRSRSR